MCTYKHCATNEYFNGLKIAIIEGHSDTSLWLKSNYKYDEINYKDVIFWCHIGTESSNTKIIKQIVPNKSFTKSDVDIYTNNIKKYECNIYSNVDDCADEKNILHNKIKQYLHTK